ncbi:[protein-PII] uridylyltransferase [Mycoavidus sp. SF9855]|uniref:[protein-PII] uridylyltransferase n=1 Tax=Mycoavidus sp. SF9855 TaxID=2968475 RepID=UPI00211C9938|nr:[protein-PII] uridylyltransferase [Mycoavidus sp. SF9855]UUM22032.1 [protein-PII] uridylyltransferase [Mycoavidus sp. SF9855]
MSAMQSKRLPGNPTAQAASFKTTKAALIEKFNAIGKIDTFMRALARTADHALLNAWHLCQLPPSFVLTAVGGFGRGELAPHSDLDILILLPAEPDANLTAKLESFIGMAWDLGLEISSSVRTIAQCIEAASQDITVQTALLEARRIGGDLALFSQFISCFNQALDTRAFFQAKLLEMQQRHAKFQDSPYSLEPNCKESPGGLRDLQLILWLTRTAGFGHSWHELELGGQLTVREARELRRNELFLKTLRARLHILAGRRQDVIAFDFQTQLAESFGYRATPAKRASEQMMRRYYWAAKAVTQLTTILLQTIEAHFFPETSGITHRLSERFAEKQGMIEILQDDLYQREPDAIFETFLLCERTPGVKGLSTRTLRALYNARNVMNQEWRRSPQNRQHFLEILQLSQNSTESSGTAHALGLMNQTSVLGRYLLSFWRIVGQMQHDLYHAYTVDQHILMVLRNLHRFGVAEHAHEYPFCSQLMMNFEQPWVLMIAALFHDIAKGRGGDHSILGMAETQRFCREHKLAAADAHLIVWLVEHHLTMSRVAQKQDTSDAHVVKRFADQVQTERQLTALYLLTVADIRGTSPKVWNAWKGKLLEDLYRLTLNTLGGMQPNTHSALALRKEQALVLLQQHLIPAGASQAFWEQLDIAYFLRHDAPDIAWQTHALYLYLETPQPIVRARRSPLGEGVQVLVYMKDQADLFAGICSYFDRHALSVLDARIHTTRHGYALDSFFVTHAYYSLDDNPHRAANETLHDYDEITARIERQLALHLAAAKPLRSPSPGRLSRQSRTFPSTPRVNLRADERGQYYILSLSANDRPGLLYAIAYILAAHQISLHAARINTLGERVEDMFLLAGAKLANHRQQIQLETELLRAIAV